MNVLLKELRMLRTGTIIWIVALVGVVLMYISLYPTFAHDAEVTETLFANIPPAVQAALGMDVTTMLSFLGFFAFTFTNLTLTAAIHAMHTGVSVMSRETRSKTIDFLLTRPRSRTSVFVQKYAAGLGVVIAAWVAVTAASFGFAKAFGAGDFDMGRFGLLMLALLIVQLWFYTCGTFLSQLLRRLKSTIPPTLTVVFGFFMLGILGAVLDDKLLRYVSPLRFFDYVGIAGGKGFEPVFVGLAVVSAVAMLAIAYGLYTKRDVRAVA